ncbi:cytochrome P450 [Ophiobolus disseminans]|uniref:Cytochrome P450 n=1 Tax=Ophiobolus disseminans TaxID=1469910 RepID=A0A6A7A397_9PLEO|nr:cytochrome P450 [Ophiobolus disseminans]
MASLVGLFLVSVPLLVLVFGFYSRTEKSLPPGPRALPVIGNLHQIPLTKPWLKFASWSHVYGSVTGLRLGTKPALVLNDWTAVSDLLDKKGSIYSSRLHMPIVQRVAGDHHTAFQAYGAKWRRSRKTISDYLKDTELDKQAAIQEAEATQLVWDLLQQKEQYRDAVLRYFGAIILASVYGIRGQWYEGGYLKRFFDMEETWAALFDKGQTPPLEVLPWLEYVPEWMTPWRGWRSKTDNIQKLQSTIYQDLLENTKKRLASGMGEDCFLARLLKRQVLDGYSDEELMGLAGVMLEGGAETSATTLLIFLLAIAAHPEFQKKAQEEIDAVFGKDQLPNGVADGNALPFLRACYLESIRWRPIAPTAVPHFTTQDDMYKGYFIPAGTIVIMNTWGLHHDTEQYEDPEAFNPMRFVESKFGVKDSKIPQDDIRRATYAFGAGRRVCPGQKMAEDSLLSSISKLLWSFDIVPQGRLDTDIRTAFKDSLVCGPKDFALQFRVRSERRKNLIQDAWLEANSFLERFE